MKLSQIYREVAAEVAERNRYTCCALDRFSYASSKAYRDTFQPSDMDVGVPYRQRWWSSRCGYRPKARKGTYAHNARVIALLLASEMAKTRDIVL